MNDITEGALYQKIYDVAPASIFAFILRMIEFYKIKDAPNVLDIGAGTGRFVDLFHKQNWHVTATEPYQEYYEFLRTRFGDQQDIHITNESFQTINYESHFDLILAVNGPFSYLLTAEDRESAISKSFEALRENGVLLIDTSNFSWILKNYREPKKQKIKINGSIVEREVIHEFDFHHNIMTHIDVFRIEKSKEIKTVHKFYMIGFQEIEYLLKKHEFSNIHTYNDYNAEVPSRLNGKRMLVTAQKC